MRHHIVPEGEQITHRTTSAASFTLLASFLLGNLESLSFFTERVRPKLASGQAVDAGGQTVEQVRAQTREPWHLPSLIALHHRRLHSAIDRHMFSDREGSIRAEMSGRPLSCLQRRRITIIKMRGKKHLAGSTRDITAREHSARGETVRARASRSSADTGPPVSVYIYYTEIYFLCSVDATESQLVSPSRSVPKTENVAETKRSRLRVPDHEHRVSIGLRRKEAGVVNAVCIPSQQSICAMMKVSPLCFTKFLRSYPS